MFREALESIHFYTFNLQGLFSFGRVDEYLLPYYEADLAAGRLTREEAQELIDCFCLLFAPTVPPWAAAGFMIGGVDRQGRPVENDLTWLFMNRISHTHLPDPGIGLCVTQYSSEDLLRFAAALLASAERIAELMARPTGTAETEIVGRVLTILALCAERYRRREPRALPDVPPLVTRTVRFIENRFAQPVTLKEIAAECGCSVTYLTRTFRQHTGKTVYALLMEYRLFHAQQLLAAGKSVTEACFASGFNDCSSFIRFFKDKVGVTPKNYRKEKSPS